MQHKHIEHFSKQNNRCTWSITPLGQSMNCIFLTHSHMGMAGNTKSTWAKHVSIKNTEVAGKAVVCQPLFVL